MLFISQGPKWYDGLIRAVSQLIYSTVHIEDFDFQLTIHQLI